MRDLKAVSSPFTLPGVQLVHLDTPSYSHFGGDPNLPAGTEWPMRNGNRLTFIARISLIELHRAHRVEWLPKSGALIFFYDMEEQPWGFDPKDKGSCAVLHVPELESPIVSAKATDGERLPRKCIGFRRIETLPSWDREPIRSLSLSDEEFDEYYSITETPYEGLPKHQVSGYPSPVQGDNMELECQLVSNGLYCGDSTGYNDPRAKTLSAGAEAWRLLLQVDSDDDLDVMWGDCGLLYFWVREADATAGRFDNTWLILQCS